MQHIDNHNISIKAAFNQESLQYSHKQAQVEIP